jgi:hypothetical protein
LQQRLACRQRWGKFRLSDPPIPTPIFRLYRPIFSRILEAALSLHRLKLADFEAIQSLHPLKYVYSLGIVSLHRSKLADFEAIQSLHLLIHVCMKGVVSLHRFKMADFKAIQSLHQMEYVYSK